MTGFRAVQRQPQAMYHSNEDYMSAYNATRDRETSQNAAAAAIAAATQFHLQQGQQGHQFEGQFSQATRRRIQPTHIGSRIPQPSVSSPSSSSVALSPSTYLAEHNINMRAPSPSGTSPSTPPMYRSGRAPNTQYVIQQQSAPRPTLHQQPPRDFANAYPMKPVYQLSCKHCSNVICARGMKAILLADTRIELYSTDTPPSGSIQLMDKDYLTRTCRCRIRDIACLGWYVQ
ncbi:hypothetical protein INT44_006763 [Umbelopsis vinacea]|uniref:Uncharacterized protein n=1 Tax=Umbelopsis vinacea TaxID=44442 RepID=A0A8H7U9C1_9FUNG|nr:hypothetical protein INT44_006763 [Umbelopsis vinacea]